MLWPSALTLLLVATVHLFGSGAFTCPISVEMADGNPAAYLLIASLCAAILSLARRLVRCGHYIRTALLLLSVPALVIIAVTSPVSDLHNSVFVLLVLGTLLWFAVMGAEHDDAFIQYGGVACLILIPLFSLIALGLSEKAYIVYALLSANALHYGHLRPPAPEKTRGR